MHSIVHALSSPLLAMAAVLWLGLASASAAEFPLTVEFDDGLTGEFGIVMVTESGGNLVFDVMLNPLVLGLDADLHRLYFNLDGSFTGLGVITGDPVATLYVLLSEPHVAGGAGSEFDYGVSFGNGAGPKGNGTLQIVTFTVFADQPLSIDDLAPLSSTAAGIAVNLAVHVQDTSFLEGVTSETVGGLMGEGDPDGEPSSADPSLGGPEPL
jgi:hypothetical protein